ncbi:MAG: nuclear transport factor 2 family protein [Caulobacterales bacterium]
MNQRDNEIIDLEKRFFQTMIDKDGDTATKLCSKDVLVGGPQGAMAVKGADMGAMMAHGQWELHSFDMRDINVVYPDDNVAVIGYKITQDMTVDGKPLKLEAADTSTWIKHGGAWHCAQHSESIIGDPYGRN